MKRCPSCKTLVEFREEINTNFCPRCYSPLKQLLRFIITGGRDYEFTPKDYGRLREVLVVFEIKEVVSSRQDGADQAGEDWARSLQLNVRIFQANRNEEMAKYADALIAFPGDDGTDDMVQQAKDENLFIIDWREEA